ncbi:MAG TPA: hypothetical protein PLD00_07355 [Methanofastidiosum sp.]|jgi:hypothetical protein|nr:hypothetical protein [Methanofastidiosum sp.]HQC24903.1 hypothetical protein [Methanofastidiosum sp.]
MWELKRKEDYFIKRYHDENPGTLFLEAHVVFIERRSRARRIDGILIPGEENIVYPQGTYSIEKLKESIQGKTIHLIESKQELGRYVIGQLVVGESLLYEVYKPEKVIMVVVCGKGNKDVEWYCNRNHIKVCIYPEMKN